MSLHLMRFENAAECVGEWVGVGFGWVWVCAFDGVASGSADEAAHVRGEGGVGGGASDGYGDAVAESVTGDSSDGSCGAAPAAAGDHAEELPGDAACAGGRSAAVVAGSKQAGEFEDYVVVEGACGADGSGAGGGAECGDDDGEIVSADVAVVD